MLYKNMISSRVIIKNHIPSKPDSDPTETSSHFPNIKKKRSFLPAPWWNDSCQDAVDLRRKSVAVFKRSSSYNKFLAFKKQEAMSKRILKSEKRKGWKRFCQNLSPNTPID